MAKFHTHYDNLKVARNAPDSVIRAAYKALMQQYHPDKYQGSAAEANRVSKIINESYQVLLDPVKRRAHDRRIDREEAKNNKTGFGDTGAEKNPAWEEPVHYHGGYEPPIKLYSNAWAYAVGAILLIVLIGLLTGIRGSGQKTRHLDHTKLTPTEHAMPESVEPSTATSPPPSQTERLSAITSPAISESAPPSPIIAPALPQSARSSPVNIPPIRETEKTKLPAIEMIKLPIGIWIGKYEVTQGQWRAIMGGGPGSGGDGDGYPVRQVSWDDVQEFIQRLNSRSAKRYRLPTEDEWYTACQAGFNTRYCGSGSLDRLAWYQSNSGGATHPVGQKSPNAWGFYDMTGNVWEWTSNCYWGDCARRVIRGGSWYSGPGAHANSFDSDSTNVRGYDVGFRLAQDP